MFLSCCRWSRCHWHYFLLLLSFLLLLLKPLTLAETPEKCPSGCQCSSDGRSADCQAAGLTQIPEAEEFDDRLEMLDLRRNRIVYLELERLAGLSRLHTLMIGQNQIRLVPYNLLLRVPQLRRLHLARNLIRSVPNSISPKSANSNLQMLDLHANQIRHISPYALRYLRHLRTLNLVDNFLQNLPEKLEPEGKPQLAQMDLHGNPWNCDCRIISLLRMIAKRRKSFTLKEGHKSHHHHHQAKCHNPAHLRHRPLDTLEEEEAKCFRPTLIDGNGKERRRLKCNLHSLSQTEIDEQNVNELPNDLASWKHSAETIDWIYRDIPIADSNVGEFQLLDDSTLEIGEMEQIENFQCALNYPPQSGARQSRDILPLSDQQQPQQQQVRAIVRRPSDLPPPHHDHHHARHHNGHLNAYNARRAQHHQRQREFEKRQRQIEERQRQFERREHQLPIERERIETTNHPNQGNQGNQILASQTANHHPHHPPPPINHPTNLPPPPQFIPFGNAPQFTYTPRDRRFREGTAVPLNCEATGEPMPTITWFFNGRPIEPSRKHEFRQNGTQIVIYPFLEHDIGTYSCEAANAHGRIKSAEAKMELIQSSPPVITEGPAGVMAKPGQRVTFRCKSRGEPRPQIGWFFNGLEIAGLGGGGGGHFQVNEDGTELSIGQVSRQDAGTYSCMAGNTVGSMTADAKLEVQSSQLDELDRRLGEGRETLLKDIVKQASDNVERAILSTKEELRGGVNSPQDLLKHFKFLGKQPNELTKAREIYEESLRLIQKHVELGLNLRPVEMPTQNISFESVLSVTHIQTLMELSGCMNGQFKDACLDMCFHSKYRSYTGQCNNFDHPTWGVSQMPFRRLLPPIYENGFNTPVGWDPQRLYFGFPKPNARSVSMELIGTEEVSAHPLYSSMLMQWGQFVDHDLDFTATALSRQTYVGGARCNRTCENEDPCFNIPLPPNDPRRAAMGRDKLPCIEFERSPGICGSGETSPIFRQITYREQVNIITSYLDGSQIYGSTEVDALDLRDLFSDHGLLRFDIVSAAQKPYLPFERDSAMDCRRNHSQSNPIRCFLSGDFRANEQIGLTAMHTIWLREHNRIATKLLEMNPDWDGERIYQETRKIVGAMLQHITYREWLPKVLGQDGFNTLIGPYAGYSPSIDPSISNAFATAAFRFGHTLIQPRLERLDRQFEPIPEGPLPLHEAFFAPERLLAEGGVDPLIRGLFGTPLKRPMSEQLLNRELTEKLFHRAHNVSLDLAALNIQRGRDHGIPGWLEYRRFCNLTVPTSWAEMAIEVPNERVLAQLKSLYGHPGNIDLWVGGIVEKRLPDGLIGPTFSCLIAEQFQRLRAGDRFWYENVGVFTPLQLAQIRKTTLAGVICRNGDEIDRIQADVFLYVGQNKLAYRRCEDIAELNIRMWMSCCDESCAALRAPNSGSGDEQQHPADEEQQQQQQRRRRRAQHIYSPLSVT